ncbi:ATP-binding protein [Bradyrhizobium sp.]|uniref:ATP-binding protein n=1 Tax=Bradyrhizobium sp. TaxID=376 RepID=UPI003C26F394
MAPTVPIGPHHRRVSANRRDRGGLLKVSPNRGAYGPRATSVQGTASIYPVEAAIELPIFLQNALILFVRESRLGMELSICRSIIEAHGGRMSVANNVGPGARFEFTLPLHQEDRS